MEADYPLARKVCAPPSRKAILFSPTFINVVSPLSGRQLVAALLNLYISRVECFHLVITISIDFRTNGSGERDKGNYCISWTVEVVTMRVRGGYNMSDYWLIRWDDLWVVISYRTFRAHCGVLMSSWAFYLPPQLIGAFIVFNICFLSYFFQFPFIFEF